ncbi:MAG: HD domain-containing protein [Oligoflexia bacterium]|nr:HD domain-containing protein [Oligoflexia bacterium]
MKHGLLTNTGIEHELIVFKDHLHDVIEGDQKTIVKKAKRLEKELSGIIDRAERYTEKLELLMEFSSILNSSLDTSRVRELAMKSTCNLLDCEGATLYLVDKEKQELYFETIVGSVSSDQLKEIRLKIDEGSIAGTVALNRRPMLINHIGQEKRHNKQVDKKSSFTTKNMVCVPLEAKGMLIGVLQAVNRFEGEFLEQDLRLLETLGHQVAIAVDNALLYQNVKNQFYETVFAMATAIEAKDRYTGGHTKRVALFSELIAKHMDLSKEEVEEVRLSAILHDIGKIGIDDKVLKKEAPLDKEEWEHMKQHPDMGYKILSHVKSMKKITDGMRFHHERPDGNGYPLGLKGNEIPLIAMIISVADTFDAMTSNRPYRKGLDYDVAYKEIVNNAGTQFDKKVVDGFIKAFKIERMGKKRSKT